MSTTDRSLEQRLTDLLVAEAPLRSPEGLADAILARTSSRRPRARWLTLARVVPMSLDRRTVFGSVSARAAVMLIAALLVTVLVVGAVVAGASLLPHPYGLVPPDRGVFRPTGSMLVPRYEGLTATTLQGGRVLIIGASTTPWGSLTYANTTDIHLGSGHPDVHADRDAPGGTHRIHRRAAPRRPGARRRRLRQRRPCPARRGVRAALSGPRGSPTS